MAGEAVYDGTLGGLFALLDRFRALPEERWPRRVRRRPRHTGTVSGPGPCSGLAVLQAGLFDDEQGAADPLVSGRGPPPELLPDPAALDGTAGILFQVSADTYDVLVCAWMSGLPVEGEALRHALRVLSAAKDAVPASIRWYTHEAARSAAAVAARNRLDEDCRTVSALAYKVTHEIDRLRGFLRFKSDARGRYTARCAPDYGILPALAPHFSRRFGDTPWAVIDDRRGLVLVREEQEPRILAAGGLFGEDAGRGDPWEELWRSYHRTVSIGSRKNPQLQRRFIPLRYRGYLSEFDDPPACPVEAGKPPEGQFGPQFDAALPGNCN
jgi:probable DNA metabolism protein